MTAAALAAPGHACEHARLMDFTDASADLLTSARMAAGMTSRARRILAHNRAG